MNQRELRERYTLRIRARVTYNLQCTQTDDQIYLKTISTSHLILMLVHFLHVCTVYVQFKHLNS